MKKLKILLLLLLLGLSPIVMNAQTTGEEVEYKFYKEVESNVHYEKDLSICENFDKNNFVYMNYEYSLSKPEDKDNRIIEVDTNGIDISSDIMNRYHFEWLQIENGPMKVIELEFIDDDGNIIDYNISDYRNVTGAIDNFHDQNDDTYSVMNFNTSLTLKFDKPVNTKYMKLRFKFVNDGSSIFSFRVESYLDQYWTNSFDRSSFGVKDYCDDDICITDFIMEDKNPTDRYINIPSIVYKYKDPYYKCYSFDRVYAPGYYKELDAYTKDEDKYRVIVNNEEEKDKLNDALTTLVLKNEENMEYLKQELVNNNEQEMKKLMDKLDELNIANQNVQEVINNLGAEEIAELKNDVSEIFKDNAVIKSYISKVDANNSTSVEEMKSYISKFYENSDKYMSLLKLVASKDEINSLKRLINNTVNTHKENTESNDEAVLVNAEVKEETNQDKVSSGLVALNTSPVKEVNYSTFTSFIFIFGVLALLVSILLTIRNVKKSRAK